MRIAIYGAGSLGTILGAYLTKAGLNCELINRNQAHVEALRTQGARVTGTVELTVPVKALLPLSLIHICCQAASRLTSRRAPTSGSSRWTSSGTWVAMPQLQRPVWQLPQRWQPRASRAAVAI